MFPLALAWKLRYWKTEFCQRRRRSGSGLQQKARRRRHKYPDPCYNTCATPHAVVSKVQTCVSDHITYAASAAKLCLLALYNTRVRHIMRRSCENRCQGNVRRRLN
jgi:hypothetical protein